MNQIQHPVRFSHARKRIWGAVCMGCGVGIDIAFPEEFKGAYPIFDETSHGER